MKRRTKIVCTIGPASEKQSTMKAMMKAGMDVARLNFSHGTHQSHTKLIQALRKTSDKIDEPVTIIGDLQGPKIRIGELPEDGIELEDKALIEFSTAVDEYDEEEDLIPVTYDKLHTDVEKGDHILIDDGLIDVRVTSIKKKTIRAKVVTGGTVTSHKGMNFPDTELGLSSLTRKDRNDVMFAVKQGVDWLALSFVTTPKDVKTLRRLVKRSTKKDQETPRIMVKIEKREAIENFDEILEEVDGVMVARGDLGIEIPAEEVPVHQKEIIEKCRTAGKPVIVATQMLDSMIDNPRPTRAEVSDVSNAVMDHTDAVMLSGESAVGKYPVKAVEAMAEAIGEAEASPFDDIDSVPVKDRLDSPESVLAFSLKFLAVGEQIDAVLSSVDLAPWCEVLFMEHPEVPFFIASFEDDKTRQMNVRWGVHPFTIREGKRSRFVRRAVRELKKKEKLKPGMRVAVVLGGDHGKGYELIEIEE